MKIYQAKTSKELEVTTVMTKNLQEEYLIYLINEELFAMTGLLPTLNVDLCNIPIRHFSYLNGSIICSPQDLILIKTDLTPSSFGQNCLEILSDYYKDTDIEIIFDNNDLLFNNKKIASQIEMFIQGATVYQTIVHFSMDINLELIEQLCTKPTEKIPGSLTEYGMTAEKLWELIYEKGVL